MAKKLNMELSNQTFHIIIVLLVIVVLYLIYMLYSKKLKMYENFNSDTSDTGRYHDIDVDKNPIVAFREGHETGVNTAKDEIRQSIENDKNNGCQNAAFYTWGRIAGLAQEYKKSIDKNEFQTECNSNQNFNLYKIDKKQKNGPYGYKLKKI